MPRYFECPDEAILTELSNSRIRCRSTDGITNLWSELGQAPNITEVSDIINLLASLSDFSLTQVAMFTSIYLAILITGFTAGNIVRLMKKA